MNSWDVSWNPIYYHNSQESVLGIYDRALCTNPTSNSRIVVRNQTHTPSRLTTPPLFSPLVRVKFRIELARGHRLPIGRPVKMNQWREKWSPVRPEMTRVWSQRRSQKTVMGNFVRLKESLKCKSLDPPRHLQLSSDCSPSLRGSNPKRTPGPTVDTQTPKRGQKWTERSPSIIDRRFQSEKFSLLPITQH